MKKRLAIFFVFALLITGKSTLAQFDTLNYLKNFELQKAQYVHQTFSLLLNEMIQIQPKSVWAGRNIRNRHQTLFSTFNFESPNNTFHGGLIKMVIYWETPIPSNELKYLSDRNHFYFTNEEKVFYSNKIVKDIMVYRTP